MSRFRHVYFGFCITTCILLAVEVILVPVQFSGDENGELKGFKTGSFPKYPWNVDLKPVVKHSLLCRVSSFLFYDGGPDPTRHCLSNEQYQYQDVYMTNIVARKNMSFYALEGNYCGTPDPPIRLIFKRSGKRSECDYLVGGSNTSALVRLLWECNCRRTGRPAPDYPSCRRKCSMRKTIYEGILLGLSPFFFAIRGFAFLFCLRLLLIQIAEIGGHDLDLHFQRWQELTDVMKCCSGYF